MPYIPQAVRDAINAELRDVDTAGELNYALTRVILDYLARNGLRYQTINDIRGALVCAGDEFNRRVAIPYEDQKIAENGDVY